MGILDEEVLNGAYDAQDEGNPDWMKFLQGNFQNANPDLLLRYSNTGNMPVVYDKNLYGKNGVSESGNGDLTYTPQARPNANLPVQNLGELVKLGAALKGLPPDLAAQIYQRFTGLDVPTSKDQTLRNALLQLQMSHALRAPDVEANRQLATERLQTAKTSAENTAAYRDQVLSQRDDALFNRKYTTLKVLQELTANAKLTNPQAAAQLEQLQMGLLKELLAGVQGANSSTGTATAPTSTGPKITVKKIGD